MTEKIEAEFVAARGFLISEWIGALLMLASFTQLYLLGIGPNRQPGGLVLALGILLLMLGTIMYRRSRALYQELGTPFHPAWDTVALLVAGSAGMFWLLFVLLAALTWFGLPIL